MKVLPFLSDGDRKEAARYKRDAGASFTDWRHRSSEQLRALVLAEFHALVVRDGMHPQAVHQAFLVIDEYREAISLDVGGAEGEKRHDSGGRWGSTGGAVITTDPGSGATPDAPVQLEITVPDGTSGAMSITGISLAAICFAWAYAMVFSGRSTRLCNSRSRRHRWSRLGRSTAGSSN